MSHFLTSHSLDTPGASQGLNGGEPVAAPLPGPGVHRSRSLVKDGRRIVRGGRFFLVSGTDSFIPVVVVRLHSLAAVVVVRFPSGRSVAVGVESLVSSPHSLFSW